MNLSKGRQAAASSPVPRAKGENTFAEVVEEFVHAPAVKGTRYRASVHLDFWNAQLGRRPIKQILRSDIIEAMAKLRQKPALRSVPGGARPTANRISASTVNRYLDSLRSVFNYALHVEAICDHPMKGGKVHSLSEPHGRTRILTSQEESKLLDAAKVSRWPLLWLFLRMCLTTAALPSEVLALQWDDVVAEKKVAVVCKNGRSRALPLVPDVRAALVEAAKAKPPSSTYVFFDPRDPEKRFRVRGVWRECRANAGLLADREDPLEQVVLHTTRHTGVAKLIRGDVDLVAAAAFSGHQTIAMLKRYEHLGETDVVKLAERVLAGNSGKTS